MLLHMHHLHLCLVVCLLFPLPVLTVLFRRSLSHYPDARCTDGTAAVYYHTWYDNEAEVKGQKNYVIYLEGGGYCPSVHDCHLRCTIANRLCTTSTTFMKDHHGILSDEVSFNPFMHDYFKIQLPYCTGDMYIGRRLGSRETDSLNFAGRFVFDAMIDSLKKNTGLGMAENVVLSGGSAGGAGVAFNCEHLQDLLPGVTVWCVVDAAFFYPVQQPFHNASTCESIDKVLQMGAELWGAPEGATFQLQNWWNNLRPDTRIFLGIAKYDVFGFESFCGDFDNDHDLDLWGSAMWPMTKRLLAERQNIGLFSAGCRYHMILHSNSLFNRLRAGEARITYAEALHNWMDGKPPATYQVWDSCPATHFCNPDCEAGHGIPDPRLMS